MRRMSSHRDARAPTAVRSDPRCPAFVQQGQVIVAQSFAYHVFHLLGRGVLARWLRIAPLQLHTHSTPHVQRVSVPLLYSWKKIMSNFQIWRARLNDKKSIQLIKNYLVPLPVVGSLANGVPFLGLRQTLSCRINLLPFFFRFSGFSAPFAGSSLCSLANSNS